MSDSNWIDPALKLLALDTATDACTVALLNGKEITERFEMTKNGHSQLVLAMIEELMTNAGLSMADMDAIAFGRGPGSFTGVRITAGVTQGLAFAAGIPVVPVSSLAVLAQGIDASHIAAAFDARMGQIYCAAYRRDSSGIVQLDGEEQVIAPSAFVLGDNGPWTGAGSGWDVYARDIMVVNSGRITSWQPGCYPHARDLVILGVHAYKQGRVVDATQALPLYLRDNVANKPG